MPDKVDSHENQNSQREQGEPKASEEVWEGVIITSDGSVTDAEFHAEFLENEAANAFADKMAYNAAITAGVDPTDAAHMILGQRTSPSSEGTAAQIPEKPLGRSAVRERQIDFMLQEEFLSNETFLGQFLALCGIADAERATCLAALSSVRDATGETDVLVSYRLHTDGPSERRVLLLENKIDAAFMKNQALRYQQRGEAGISNGLWKDFASCLVAPQRYIKPNHGFHHVTALETLMPLLAPESNARQHAKQAILRSAIEEQARQGVKDEDKVVTAFRRGYYKAFLNFQSEHAAALATIEPDLPRIAWHQDTWFLFKGFGHGIYINHKAEHDPGVVDLTFTNTRAEDLERRATLEADMSVVQTGKSAAVRLIVPSVKCHREVAEQDTQLQQAFQAVLRLTSFLRAM